MRAQGQQGCQAPLPRARLSLMAACTPLPSQWLMANVSLLCILLKIPPDLPNPQGVEEFALQKAPACMFIPPLLRARAATRAFQPYSNST